MTDYRYKDRSLPGFFAMGNGGQHVIGIPELNLVIGFYAGNYNDRLPVNEEYVEKWILPGVVESR